MEVGTEVMEMVSYGGEARSKALQAIRFSRKKDFVNCEVCIRECEEKLAAAHEIQTSLIQNECAGGKTEISMLMIHAQDHLMNAITVYDLAKEMIAAYRGEEE